MSTSEQTVFISYRRDVSAFIARAVFQDLRAHGYDVFLDVETIDNGQFEHIILSQIAARTHFIVILTPGAVERCAEPGDWLRREIERAVDLGRNIVPLLVNGFRFKDAEAYLTGKLAYLPRYNALTVPHEYFEEAMARLRSRYLKVQTPVALMPTPAADRETVQHKIDEAASQPAPTETQLSAEEYFNRAFARDPSDLTGKIADYTEALALNPEYAIAYHNRGLARHHLRDYPGALADYNNAIRLNPNDAFAYNNRGLAHKAGGDFDGALADFRESIRLDPTLALPHSNLGNTYKAKNDLARAIASYTAAIAVNPQYAEAYYNRGIAHESRGDLAEAVADYEQYLALGGGEQNHNRAEVEGVIQDLKARLK